MTPPISTLAPPDRAGEVQNKLTRMRGWLHATQASALRLRGVDWFSWATAGGSSVVLQSSETGVAEVLVTAGHAHVLTDDIELQRLQEEEVPNGFEWHASPWAETDVRERFVAKLVGAGGVLSDRPQGDERAMPPACHADRLVLSEAEQQRYRHVGQLARSAMTEVMRAARPTWSEQALAGAGAEALWARGLHPILTLAAGSQRVARYRHPTPTQALLDDQAMLVFCARGFGLVANLTRFVEFAPCSAQQHQQHEALQGIEAAGLQVCRAGLPLSGVYHALKQAYGQAGFEQAIAQHHQGGITGYLAREDLALPGSTLTLADGMALALNPSLPGVKLEDTFLMQPGRLENRTLDPAWPATQVAGRLRPLPLEAP